MPIIKQSVLVPYSAEQMYQLVNDYKKYPEFLSGCIGTNTISTGENQLQAELIIQKLGIHQRFSTSNTMIPNKCITMTLLEGPFQYLNGQWRFDTFDEQSCQISLEIDFEFSNTIIALVFGKIFNELTRKMVNAFKQRAKEIYNA